MTKIIFQILYFFSPKSYKLKLEKMKIGYGLVTLEDSYLVETGYLNSKIQHSLINSENKHVPWMNYPLIEFLNEKLSKDLVVFEYGSGSSTIYFAERTKKVISIEYDKEWFDIVKNMLAEKAVNGTVHFEELGESYPNSIETHLGSEKCDIAIIDGRMRVKCAKKSLDFLSDRGVLLFDDSHRERYQEGIEFYKEKGFRAITFKGLKPTGFSTDSTTVLYRDGNCLGI